MIQSFQEEVLNQLRETGSDIKKPHKFDFYLYFPSKDAAGRAADKVRESEFTAEVLPAVSGGRWICLANVTIVPEVAPLDEIGCFLEQVAAALEGEFDGWESDVIG